MKESTANLDERFRKKQADLWHQLFSIWTEKRDAVFLAELMRVDLKMKTESKQIRNLKIESEWRNF